MEVRESSPLPISSVPKPIPEFQCPIKLKRGRPPKMRRELQVKLSPLSVSCTKLLLQKRSEANAVSVSSTESSETIRKTLKREIPVRLHGKIKFNFFSSKFVRSPTKIASEDKDKPSTSSSTAMDNKDSQENSDHNSVTTEEKNQHEVESEDLNWGDDYGFYRPVRAAAAAALEAVQGRKTQDELIRLRLRNKVYTKQPPPKGRNRRNIFRRTVGQIATRGITSKTAPVTSKSIFHRGVYYQEGDIVIIVGEDGKEYYCQIKSIMRDCKFKACANLRWLIPKQGFKDSLRPFNPANFEVCEGVPEQIITLDSVQFLMHCPNDYYYEHPVTFFQPVKGTVYMRLGEPLVSVEKVPINPKISCGNSSEEPQCNNNSEAPNDS